MCHCGEHNCSSDGHGNDATQQGRRCRSDRRRSACRRRRRGRGRGSACTRWRPPPDHQQRMAPAWRPRGRCHVERDRTALVAASGPRGGEPESISVHRRRGVGGRDIGRSGSPTPMIRPATAGVRSYRAGIRRGAVSVEMGRSRTSCSSTWARSPLTSRPSWQAICLAAGGADQAAQHKTGLHSGPRRAGRQRGAGYRSEPHWVLWRLRCARGFARSACLISGMAKDARSADPRRGPEAPTRRPEHSNRNPEQVSRFLDTHTWVCSRPVVGVTDRRGDVAAADGDG